MKQYDLIIVGAGASGLSLACRLAASPLRRCSMLLVDRSLRPHPDRTWAFWSRTRMPFDSAACRSWQRLIVATAGHKQTLRTEPYSFKVIRGGDFYCAAHDRLAALPNLHLLEGRVDGIVDSDQGASVSVDGCDYRAQWVFDSRFRLADFRPDPLHHYLRMQFRGWEIETERPAFEAATATFLDFRTPQEGQARFLYVLPYDERHALIEHVACVPWRAELLRRQEQEHALDAYIRDVLGTGCYQVTGQEQGVNPMTDYPFPRRGGRHIMRIGIPGGMLKPTTGFAFTRIQRDSAAIVRSLLEQGHPFDVPGSRWGYRWYESLMLGAMERHGGQVGSLLAAFFRLGSTPHIMRFLDEKGLP